MSEEGQMFEKKRSEKEIKRLCLIAWESLRRNTEYRKEYDLLKRSHFENFGAIDAFCEKWKVPVPLDPSLGLKKMCRPQQNETPKQALKRIEFQLMDRALETLKEVKRQRFSQKTDFVCKTGDKNKALKLLDESYQKEFSERDVFRSDDAAFTILLGTPIQNKYLPIYINLSKPKKQILSEIEKLLDYWLSDKTREFYGIKPSKQRRTHVEKLERAYRIYDMKIVDKLSLKDIALKLHLSESTVERDYYTAKLLIDAIAKQEKDEVKSGGITPRSFEEIADREIAKQYLQDILRD